MYFRLRMIYLKISQSNYHCRNILKKMAYCHRLTKHKQDAKDKLTWSHIKKSLKIPMR